MDDSGLEEAEEEMEEEETSSTSIIKPRPFGVMGMIIPRRPGYPPGRPSPGRLVSLAENVADPDSYPPPTYPPGYLPDHLNPLQTAYLFPGGIPRDDLNPPSSLTGRWLPTALNPLHPDNNPPGKLGAAFELLAAAFPEGVAGISPGSAAGGDGVGGGGKKDMGDDESGEGGM